MNNEPRVYLLHIKCVTVLVDEHISLRQDGVKVLDYLCIIKGTLLVSWVIWKGSGGVFPVEPLERERQNHLRMSDF